MFDSCSAYQDSRPHILFLSHCVPNPPDKGEKIRAHYELKALTEDFRVHLACLARTADEVEQAKRLTGVCASVHVERLRLKTALARAGTRFLLGACLNEAFYDNRALHRQVDELARGIPLAAAFVYTAVMAPYVPSGMPMLLDFVDVDCEKWADYAQRRRPAFVYGAEARRMHHFERLCAEQASERVVTTENEARILRRIAPGATVVSVENGVDSDFFDGRQQKLPNEPNAPPFVAFVGSMDYYPNVDAAVRFAREVFPELRRRVPDLAFFVIGRNPSSAVLKLRNEPNVRVLGGVPDVRPYLSSAAAIVAPLGLARGIQNKVLEALAMGRKVFASHAVCRTFGTDLPCGVVRCSSAADFVAAIVDECRHAPSCDEKIRQAACRRFSWSRNMQILQEQFSRIIEQPARGI